MVSNAAENTDKSHSAVHAAAGGDERRDVAQKVGMTSAVAAATVVNAGEGSASMQRLAATTSFSKPKVKSSLTGSPFQF